MSEPYLGEIRMFAGNFAPRGWALCNGQILPITSNEALFSLFGTIYGGDGRTSFALPDLRGRIPMHQGTGPGLSGRNIGQRVGAETVALTEAHLPSHSHTLAASTDTASNAVGPEGAATGVSSANLYGPDTAPATVAMDSDVLGDVGGSGAHPNMGPSLAIHFIVALTGVYPSRS